jgi:hypothetical protein
MSEPEEKRVPQYPRGSWYGIAKEMRDAGMAYAEIGRRLGYSGPAVYFALHPHKRWYKKDKGAEAPSPVVTPPPADL